jgi:hypothetical protein
VLDNHILSVKGAMFMLRLELEFESLCHGKPQLVHIIRKPLEIKCSKNAQISIKHYTLLLDFFTTFYINADFILKILFNCSICLNAPSFVCGWG